MLENNQNVRDTEAENGDSERNNAGGPKWTNPDDIGFLLDVPLEVSVEVGRAKLPIKDFIRMKEGGIIELDKMADEPLDLYVNSRLIARGEAVVVNDKFGLRLIDVVSTRQRLENLR